jgi:hypothetical protein
MAAVHAIVTPIETALTAPKTLTSGEIRPARPKFSAPSSEAAVRRRRDDDRDRRKQQHGTCHREDPLRPDALRETRAGLDADDYAG